MRALVTGVAGFIGSNLADHLLAQGHEVVGVDSLSDYYDPEVKRRNLARATGDACFSFRELDLVTDALGPVLDGVDVVFHQAGQPGVRLSWADGFGGYDRQNVLATQRLLEQVRDRPLRRFVFASSSSVYGNAAEYPTPETALPRPHSPYGVTKLAAEHLCSAYAENFGVPAVALRYFTVYGPRQRPDMAIHRMIRAALDGTPFPIYGDGSQVRSFTYVGDVVRANVAAAEAADVAAGSFLNVAGGGEVTVSELISIVEETCGRTLQLDRQPAQPGDVARTGGDSTLASTLLGWQAEVDVRSGVAAQAQWHADEAASR